MTLHNRERVVVPILLAVLLLVSGPAVGFEDVSELVVEAFTLQHRSAAQAMAVVYPLLSSRGTVELQPGENTLVLRDVAQAIERMMPLLREFDRPSGRVRVRVQVVQAGAPMAVRAASAELSPRVLSRLKKLLRYESYTLLAQTEFETQEGLESAYELSNEYRIAFRLDRQLEDRRIRLQGFEVSRRVEGERELRPLIHTNLNLNLGRPLVLGLATTEASDHALMVIVECNEGDMLLTER